jgi:hypothetical protein
MEAKISDTPTSLAADKGTLVECKSAAKEVIKGVNISNV